MALAAASVLLACQPDLRVGEWTCADNSNAAPQPSADQAVAVPWSTGFEDDFCDYVQPGGFCYGDPLATYTTVTTPVHSGQHAAAFSVMADNARARQTRCVRQGVLPQQAYYGAWYFIPERAVNSALWNLVHFQGGDTTLQHGLWDISLVNTTDGELEAVVFNFLGGTTYRAASTMPIPIGSWFHLELYLKRASDQTGEVALYQDDKQLFDVANIVTDDSTWGQWYVGNLASGLSPADSTVYVDDVTIRATH